MRTLSLPFARPVLGDYLTLTKPKVVALLLLTALVGMVLATPHFPSPARLLTALLGIGLLASGAAALNQVLEQELDARMSRTRHRPLVTGRLGVRQGLTFALGLSLLGFILLYLGVNPLCAWLTLASLVGYAGIYTLLLKRATPQNIVIGGLAGAMPPLLGWVAITGSLAAEPWLLVMIVFAWTPPHFWALAIHRQKDYARAGIPMLPITHGITFTKSAILLYQLILALICLLPYLIGMSGLLYLAASLLLNGRFIQHGWRLRFAGRPEQAWRTFRFSITHLMLLFAALIIDHYWFWQIS